MLRQKFNQDWVVFEGAENPMMAALRGQAVEGVAVNLPHDAMIREKRREDVPSGTQSGYYPGGKYTYIKKWDVPKEWADETVTLEFEGVYGATKVFINGEYAVTNHNGYMNFYINADRYLKYGEENEIKLDVNNSMQPNSRWYSGSGIYRDVNIMRASLTHIAVDGVRITTPQVDQEAAVVSIDTQLVNESRQNRTVRIEVQILDAAGNQVAEDVQKATVYGNDHMNIRQRIIVKNPELWSCEQPALYTYKVKMSEGELLLDEEQMTFGIRSLQLDPIHGLRINGTETKLRGACIHHDNGVIGACTLERAEQRRCEQLKEAGFNCIRSSHHPVSKAMLDACDRVGMLVMDELSDMWNQSKNSNDYSVFFEDEWETAVEQMVRKDFNHPSVIMYSMGNEIPEIATLRAADLNRKINNKIKGLDDTRYTTNALNGLMAAGSKMREIMGDIMSRGAGNVEQMSQKSSSDDEKEGGSNQMNSMMSIMNGPLADVFAAHPIMTEIFEEVSASMDIAGYNYLTGRHELEHELYPNRVVVGAETYPSDIVTLWKIVKENAHMIGDFTWTGYDYLGEAGIGIFYYDGRQGFGQNWPSSVAYIGDINIIGYRRPISYLREIVFGLRKAPYIAVERLNRYGMECNKTAWMCKDNIASWTWPGYEGKPAVVDVYSDAEEVELFSNGVSMGRKATGEANEYTAVYEIEYQPGKLEAVAYRNGLAEERFEIVTAQEAVNICAAADRTELTANGADASYITIGLKDENGYVNLNAVKEISVEIEGPATIQGFGSAEPETFNHYDNHTWETFDGSLLAVVRAGYEEGEVKVTFKAEGLSAESVILQIRNSK